MCDARRIEFVIAGLLALVLIAVLALALVWYVGGFC